MHFYQSAQNTGRGWWKRVNLARALRFTKPSTNCFASLFWSVWKANRHKLRTQTVAVIVLLIVTVWFTVISHELFELSVSFFHATYYSLTKFLQNAFISSPVPPAAPLWDRLVREASPLPGPHHPAFLVLPKYWHFLLMSCLTESVFTFSTNTSSPMVLKLILCFSALPTNSQWGKTTVTHTHTNLV